MAAAEEPDPIRLDAIAIEPNPAPLTAQLDVHVDFEAQDTFPQAFWEITVRSAKLTRRRDESLREADSFIIYIRSAHSPRAALTRRLTPRARAVHRRQCQQAKGRRYANDMPQTPAAASAAPLALLDACCSLLSRVCLSARFDAGAAYGEGSAGDGFSH